MRQRYSKMMVAMVVTWPKVHFPSTYLIRVVGWLEPTPAVTEQEEGYTPGLS